VNTLRIQGREVEAQDGESLLEAARRHGFEIPTLCHHPALTAYGSCRICLVEVTKRGKSKITAACTHPALPGLEVALDTERVARVRRLALELLLAHAPEATEVRALALRYGVGSDAASPRFGRVEEPLDCILCGLCERACRDVVGAAAVTISGRGDGRRVGAPFGCTDLCVGCGTCEALCPAGTKVLHDLREGALARFRKLQGEDRLCRYALMGLLPAALCANDFRCERCETEQVMVDRAGSGEHPLMWAVLTGEREVQR
jgi:bidirectional [NiFe] hydrogenase diaphorase subunit